MKKFFMLALVCSFATSLIGCDPAPSGKTSSTTSTTTTTTKTPGGTETKKEEVKKEETKKEEVKKPG